MLFISDLPDKEINMMFRYSTVEHALFKYKNKFIYILYIFIFYSL